MDKGLNALHSLRMRATAKVLDISPVGHIVVGATPASMMFSKRSVGKIQPVEALFRACGHYGVEIRHSRYLRCQGVRPVWLTSCLPPTHSLAVGP